MTFWTDSLEKEAGESFESMLDEIGLEAKLKVVNVDNYFTVIGDEKTPDLDIGYRQLRGRLPGSERVLRTAALRRQHPADQQHQPLPLRRSEADKKIEELATKPMDPALEDEYAALDKEFMEQAPLAPYGARRRRLFVSSDIDFGAVVWNPIFSGDLTSFQFK